MRVRSLLLALLLGCGLAAAADQSPKAPKPQKVNKHAVGASKSQRYSKSARKGASHKSPKAGKRKTGGRKFAKHKTAKFKKHKA